ncbi:MAG: glycosyltransferase family 2 protein [Candidatus Acidiferrales bacterium]
MSPQSGEAAHAHNVSFWYARPCMLLVFYVLVIQQVLQGLYSLWQGIAWLGYVRRRLSTHAGFYTPQVALICPCKGSEPGLETSLMSLTKFEYSNYEIFFTLATSLDPAIKAIERVKATSPRKIHIVIVGPPEDSGEKVSNLRKAVEKLDESFNVIVFVDSDVTLSRAWLTKLISPLGDARVGAATTYRWLIPTRWPNKQDFASALGSAWNASVATMLGDHGHNFCWGGGTAIRRGTFNDINALEFWQGAVSDDLALTNALENQNKQILFVPECMAPTLYGATFAELLEFTNRQIILTRVYSPRMWAAGFLSHASYVITSIVALFVVFSEMITGDPWGQLLLLALAIPLLATMKGALRTIAIGELLPEWKTKMRDWSWVWTALAPIVPFLFFWNFCVSLVSKTIRWRGIRYRLVSANQTQILKR